MKTVVCTKFGPPEVLQFKDTPKPDPKENEILVKLHATTVTVADFRVRSFTIPLSFWLLARIALGFRKPRKEILGTEFAGEVEATGKNVTQFKKGDYVFAYTGVNFGAYSEYCCLAETDVVALKPHNLTCAEAVSLTFGGFSALYFLDMAHVQKGQKVLVYGASGSVGSSAVQIAKLYGAEVTAVCSSGNLELVRSLGADNAIDYTKDDFTKNGEQYDVIFDTVGKTSLFSIVRSLKKGGTFLTAVGTPAVTIQMLLLSTVTGTKMKGGHTEPTREKLLFLKELAETGKLKPVIDRHYSFEQIVEAHRYVDKGHKKGSVVIDFS